MYADDTVYHLGSMTSMLWSPPYKVICVIPMTWLIANKLSKSSKRKTPYTLYEVNICHCQLTIDRIKQVQMSAYLSWCRYSWWQISIMGTFCRWDIKIKMGQICVTKRVSSLMTLGIFCIILLFYLIFDYFSTLSCTLPKRLLSAWIRIILNSHSRSHCQRPAWWAQSYKH